MSGRVQGPPRGGIHPSMKALVLLILGFACMATTILVGHLLVAAAVWAWELLGVWLLVLVAVGVGWVARTEKRRAK